jgi:hypothetical protein
MFVVPKGNLVKNPGFELGLAFWQVPTLMPGLYGINAAAFTVYSHSGLASLFLGICDPAFLSAVYQDVNVSPGARYELGFSLAGLGAYPAAFQAEVHWLDEDGEDLGPALSIFVPEVGPAQAGGWTLHTGITEEAPLGARRARVSFARGCPDPGVLLDDVSLVKSE